MTASVGYFQFWKYLYDTDAWINVPAIRKVNYSSIETPKASSWMESAACGAADPEDFEPVYNRNSDEENEARFERARKICDSCPVITQCEENSSITDKWYTFRAGQEPGQYVHHKKSKKITYLTRSTSPEGKCKHGHNDWVMWGGRPKCRTCDRNTRINGDPAIMAP